MTPEERIYPMFTERVKPMSSLKQDVAAINPGDQVTIKFALTDEYDGYGPGEKDYEISGEAWLTRLGSLCVGTTLIRWSDGYPAVGLTEVVEHVPAKPEWHDAKVISAMIGAHVGRRYLLNDRRISSNKPWSRAFCGDAYYYTDEQLSDVIIIVDKDGKTRV